MTRTTDSKTESKLEPN